MKIFLGFLALISCTVLQVTCLGHINALDSFSINPLYVSQNQNVRNPLLLGSSEGLTVLDKLHNIRKKLEGIENKNVDLPIVSPVRSPENQFQSINSFVDDLSVATDNKERSNSFEIRPFSMLEKIPVIPSSLNGYFVMFRMKQNVSDLVPTKSQTRFTGNEQQHYIQHNRQEQEQAVSQQQPFTIQRQVTNQQQSVNNQQMHIRKLNIQDQSSNHGSHLSDQHDLSNQQQSADNRGHHTIEQQRSINQGQPISDRRSHVSIQQFSSNEGRVLNGQQNTPRPDAHENTSINQHLSIRNLQQSTQQQPGSNTQNVPGQQGMLRISHRSTINQYIRPEERTPERIVSDLSITENPTNGANNFEYSSGHQIQSFADELLKQIHSQALNGESQPAFLDNLKSTIQARMISDGITSHQASMLADLERSTVSTTEATENGGQILHETRLSNGASVTQHLKTPYANYDFSHLL